MIEHTLHNGNRRTTCIILAAGLAACLLYGWAAVSGDLLEKLPFFFVLHGTLLGLMLLVWRVTARVPSVLPWALGISVLLRLVSAWGAPALSDDVYRYVWDGRVQQAGHHPYSYSPLDERLSDLRDDDWTRINNPELKTIYPPLSQFVFALLARAGAGPLGFKLFAALADLAVLAGLLLLVRKLGLPGHRVLLYAWNPLAIFETAGSGHIEPLGVALVLLAAYGLLARRAKLSAVALAAAVQVKLFPLVLVPGAIRRWRNPALWVFLLVLVGLAVPYALTGPAIGDGLFDYAGRWERNAVIYSGLESTLEWADSAARLKPWLSAAQDRFGGSEAIWTFIYARVWPREIARLVVALLALAWVVRLSFRRGLSAPRECFYGLAGVLLLAPTLHPWYVLWVLPFAVAYLSWPWLAFAALVPLAYLGGSGDVPWLVRAIEYGIPLALWVTLRLRARALPRGTMAP